MVRTWCVLYILTSKNVLRATTACTFSTSQLPKVVRTWCVLYIFTSKCASRHNGVHFFDISTSKSAPRPRCFVHFDFEMCFAPQCRALFQHLNFQKCSEPLSNLTRFTSKCASRHNGVHFFDISTSKSAPNPQFLTLLLPNVLRATTACTFSTSQLPQVLRTPQFFNTFYFQICFAPQRRALFLHLNFQKRSDAEVFCTFSLRNRLRATTACNFSSLIWPAGSAPAALASLLFDPPGPQIIGKTQCFATFLPFRAPASSFF